MSDDALPIIQNIIDKMPTYEPSDPVASPNTALERVLAVAEFADNLATAAEGHIVELKNNALVDYMVDLPEYQEIDFVADNPALPAPLAEVVIPAMVVPGVPFPYPIPDPDDVVITTDPPPDYSPTKPPITIPPAPNVPFPSFTEEPPQISSPEIPEKPIYTLPPVPRIDDITIPSPPEYNIPPWEGTAPTQDLTPPEPMFVWNEIEYDSTLKQLVSTKLGNEIVNGGRGIDTAWEAAFLARRRSDLADKHEEMYIEAENRWAGRGFAMPPGALAGAILEIQKQVLRNEENLANDIIIKQEELAYEYGKFLVEAALQWEKTLMDNENYYKNRAFEAAKYVVESALVVYQAKVEAYKAQLAAYQVEAQVYEARIRAEIGKAELYKAEIEGKKAEVGVKQALIEAYKAQIAGINTLVDLYRAEMQGAQIQADIDRTKIESYQALVQAYAARIQAIKVRYEAYEAQISGEAEKVKIWIAEAEAYEAEVKGYAAKANVDVARAEAQLKINMSEVEVFKALVQKYDSEVDYVMKTVDAAVGHARVAVEARDVTMKQTVAEIGLKGQIAQARAESLKAQAMFAQASATTQAAAARANATIAAATAEAAARIGAATIAAAYAGLSFTASAGFREVYHGGGTNNRNYNSTHIGRASGETGTYRHYNYSM